MSTLVVIGYDDPFKAEEVRLKLLKMQKDYLIDLEDAVVATKDKDGKVKIAAITLMVTGAGITISQANPLLGSFLTRLPIVHSFLTKGICL